jgi:hypothetical protein
MEVKKTFTVNKEEFQKNFLEPINKFKAGSEFLPLYYLDGKIVVFCAHRAKESKATIGLYIEFEPESCNLEEGDVFYVRDPAKIQKTMALLDGDRLVIRVTKSQIIADGDTRSTKYRLYDSILASKDKSFWKPTRFATIRSIMGDGVKLDKSTIETIQKASASITDDLAHIEYDEDTDENYIIIGDQDRDCFKLQIPHYEGFSKFSKFSKFLFNVIGRNDVNFSETTNHKMMTLTDKSELTTKYCFVAKFD